MPADEEANNAQLTAIRRYIATLAASPGGQGGRNGRPGWWAAAAAVGCALLVLGIVIGAAAGSDRQRSPQRAAPAAPAVSPACKAAVDRANQSLAIAAQVEAALAEHTKIMNDLLHGKINGSTALKTGMPSLVTGASQSARFDIALADYQQVVKRCQLR